MRKGGRGEGREAVSRGGREREREKSTSSINVFQKLLKLNVLLCIFVIR